MNGPSANQLREPLRGRRRDQHRDQQHQADDQQRPGPARAAAAAGAAARARTATEPEHAEQQLLGEHRVRRAARGVGLDRRRREHHHQAEQRSSPKTAEHQVQRGQRPVAATGCSADADRPIASRAAVLRPTSTLRPWRASSGVAARRTVRAAHRAADRAGRRGSRPAAGQRGRRGERVARGRRSRGTCPSTPRPGQQHHVTGAGQRGGRARPRPSLGDLRTHRRHRRPPPTVRRPGDIRRVSGECGDDRRRVDAEQHHAPRSRCRVTRATSSSTEAPLSMAAGDPHHPVGGRSEGGGGRVRVGRLGVVDVATPSDLGDDGAAVPARPERAQPGRDRGGGRRAARASAAAASALVTLGGPPGGTAATPASSSPPPNARSTSTPVDARRAGRAPGSPSVTPTRARRGRRGQQRGGRRVVDPGDRDRRRSAPAPWPPRRRPSSRASRGGPRRR